MGRHHVSSGRNGRDEREEHRDEGEINRLVGEESRRWYTWGPWLSFFSFPFPDLVGDVELMLLFGGFREGGL